jgi:hypothetical protein
VLVDGQRFADDGERTVGDRFGHECEQLGTRLVADLFRSVRRAVRQWPGSPGYGGYLCPDSRDDPGRLATDVSGRTRYHNHCHSLN